MDETKSLLDTLRGPYADAARTLAQRHGIKVKRWRTSNSGVAYTAPSKACEIEAPLPKGPISFGVFAHEVGHIVLHTANGKFPRWREEAEAWDFALATMEEFHLQGSERVEAFARPRIHQSFWRAVRRGVDPDEIEATCPWWSWWGAENDA